MGEILVIQHTPEDGPGYFARFLGREGTRYRLFRIDEGDPVPASTEGVSGLVLMGGPQSANDALHWILPELQLIREAVARDIPVLGHCLGGQLLSKALGGRVDRSPEVEIGWLPVRKLSGAGASDWLEGLPREFDVFQWHEESFSIPPGAERVLESWGCPNQGFAIGRSLGLQCHIEMLPEMVQHWARDFAHAIPQPSDSVQSPDEMLADLEKRAARLHDVADWIYGRWLRELS